MTDRAGARWDARTRSTLFPSLGFYGAKVADRLEVPLPADVEVIRLRLPRTPAEVLDVRLVQLVRGKTVLKVPATAVTGRASSLAKKRLPDAAAPLTQGTPVTTRRQSAPWWEFTLVEPLGATSMRVFNRRDALGRRTRALVVQGRTAAEDAPWRTLWDLQKDDLAAAIAVVERLLDRRLRPPRFRRQAWVERVRSEVLTRIVDAASRDRIPGIGREDVRLLLALVPSGQPDAAPALTEVETQVLAALLVAQRVAVAETATSIRSFGDVLPDRGALRRLDVELNRFGARAGLPPLAITRHGVSELGALQSDADGHLDLVDRLVGIFASLGHPLVAAYGTLLGAVREGNFLRHDDDIDMLFRLQAPDADAAAPLLAELRAQLAERGFGIWKNPTGMNFHVIDKAARRHVDVFPYLVDGDVATLHMAAMKLAPMALDVLEPHGERELLGRTIPVPHQPETFLEERYGSRWGDEDPYYDWVWPLSS